MKKIKIASAEYFIKFITSEMNSPHKNDKKFAQMFVLPDFFFLRYIDRFTSIDYLKNNSLRCRSKILSS